MIVAAFGDSDATASRCNGRAGPVGASAGAGAAGHRAGGAGDGDGEVGAVLLPPVSPAARDTAASRRQMTALAQPSTSAGGWRSMRGV